jgi:riboflavin transporter 2
MASWPVYVAVMLFGMSTWISIVGVWVEMPLLVNQLPESWRLPSYLVIIIQCANFGPAMYAIYDKIRPRTPSSNGHNSVIDVEIVVSFAVLLTAAVSVLLLSFLWPIQADIGGVQHSIALLTLVAAAALASCTSSVVYLPYMARLPSVYISAFYFGQGLCGLVPGIAGLVQGASSAPECLNITDSDHVDFALNGTYRPESSYSNSSILVRYKPPRFGVSAFFGFLFAMVCVSAASFACLNFIPRCREAASTTSQVVRNARSEEKVNDPGDEATSNDNKDGPSNAAEETSPLNVAQATETDSSDARGGGVVTVVEHEIRTVKRHRFVIMLTTVGVTSALWNGVLPATQSYTCLPYGNLVYKLSICLSWVCSPLATIPNMISPTSSLPLISCSTLAAVALSAFHLVLAAQSPHPVLQGQVIGQVLVVCIKFFCLCIVTSLSVLSMWSSLGSVHFTLAFNGSDCDDTISFSGIFFLRLVFDI